jgi:hypothetical protein
MCSKTSTVTPEKNNKESVTDIINEKIENKVFIDIDDGISVELDTKEYIYVKDSDSNKFIGYLVGRFPNLQIDELYVYEKYIVIKLQEQNQDNGLWNDTGYYVYEYNKNLKIMDCLNSENKLYEGSSGPYHFKGIYNDFLFIDEGTGPGTRGIEIFDLSNNVSILDTSYYESFSFYDNIVSGLVMSEWDVEHKFNDDIKTIFYEYEQKTNMPEWLINESSRFIVKYKYNILTKEINITSGEYIFVQ